MKQNGKVEMKQLSMANKVAQWQVSSQKLEEANSPWEATKVERQKKRMIIYGQKRTNPHNDCGEMIEFTSAVIGLVSGSASWCSVDT